MHLSRLWRLQASVAIAESRTAKPFSSPARRSFTPRRRCLCSHLPSSSGDGDGDESDENKNTCWSITPHPRASIKAAERSVSLFFERTEAIRRLVELLNARKKPWNAESVTEELDSFYASAGNGTKPTPFLVSEVIRISPSVDPALHFFRWWKLLEGREQCRGSWAYVAMMNRLGSSGRIAEMEAMASECESEGLASVETFTVQLSVYRNKRCFHGALSTWKRMERLGIKPNIVSYIALLDVFSIERMYDLAGDLYLHSLSKGFIPNVKMLTVLIYHLADSGKLEAASDMFAELPKVKLKPNPLTFSALMRGYAKHGRMDKVVELARQFKEVGNRPHRDVFRGLFRFLLEEERIDDARRVVHELWVDSAPEDREAMIMRHELEAGSKSRSVDEDKDIGGSAETVMEGKNHSDEEEEEAEAGDEDDQFRAMKGASIWNYIGLVRCMTPWTSATGTALSRANVKWDGHLVSEVMKRIGRPDVAWKFFTWIQGKNGFIHNEFTYSRMIQLLLTSSDFEHAKKLLVEAQSKGIHLSLHVYNHVLKLCGLKCEANAALDVFSLLKAHGLAPDRVSYQSLIHALHKCGRCWRVATVCVEMERAGFKLDPIIYSFVVGGFARAGKMKYAKAFYGRMRKCGFEPSEHIYEAFVLGFYRAGQLHKAEKTFVQMKRSGMSPSLQLCNLMVDVYQKNKNEMALDEVLRERKAVKPTKEAEKRKMLDMYLKFHQQFVGSLARDVDDSDDNEAKNVEECYG